MYVNNFLETDRTVIEILKSKEYKELKQQVERNYFGFDEMADHWKKNLKEYFKKYKKINKVSFN